MVTRQRSKNKSLSHVHKLFTNPDHSPVHQKRRKFALEYLKVIEEEMAKLIKAKVIREIYYLDWSVNVVVPPKKGGNRECVLILPTSTRLVQKTIFHYPNLTWLLMQPPSMSFSTSWTPFLVIIRKNISSRREKNFFYHGERVVLLQSHAIWTKERRGDIPNFDQQDVQRYDWLDNGSLHRWHAGQKPQSCKSHRPLEISSLRPKKTPYDAYPLQMYFWSILK